MVKPFFRENNSGENSHESREQIESSIGSDSNINKYRNWYDFVFGKGKNRDTDPADSESEPLLKDHKDYLARLSTVETIMNDNKFEDYHGDAPPKTAKARKREFNRIVSMSNDIISYHQNLGLMGPDFSNNGEEELQKYNLRLAAFDYGIKHNQESELNLREAIDNCLQLSIAEPEVRNIVQCFKYLGRYDVSMMDKLQKGDKKIASFKRPRVYEEEQFKHEISMHAMNFGKAKKEFETTQGEFRLAKKRKNNSIIKSFEEFELAQNRVQRLEQFMQTTSESQQSSLFANIESGFNSPEEALASAEKQLVSAEKALNDATRTLLANPENELYMIEKKLYTTHEILKDTKYSIEDRIASEITHQVGFSESEYKLDEQPINENFAIPAYNDGISKYIAEEIKKKERAEKRIASARNVLNDALELFNNIDSHKQKINNDEIENLDTRTELKDRIESNKSHIKAFFEFFRLINDKQLQERGIKKEKIQEIWSIVAEAGEHLANAEKAFNKTGIADEDLRQRSALLKEDDAKLIEAWKNLSSP